MEIKIFDNYDIQIVIQNEEPLFEIYTTGKALGYSRWDGKTYDENGNEKLFTYKSRIDKIIVNADIEPIVIDNNKYFT